MAQPIKGQRPNKTPVPAWWFAGATPPGPSISVAVTDGADVSATAIGVLVDVTSTTTDGADASSASIGVRVDVSSATTDGADVAAASIGTRVDISSATTDGADVAAASLTSTVDVSSATTDGADVSAASVTSSIDVSSATTDGADISVALVSTGAPVGPTAVATGTIPMLVPSSFDLHDERSWAEWNLFHIISHNELFDAALQQSVAVQGYPLDYDDRNETWKEVHQIVHQSYRQSLGLTTGFQNLSDVDFTDPDQFHDWMYYHALEHQQIKTALGL